MNDIELFRGALGDLESLKDLDTQIKIGQILKVNMDPIVEEYLWQHLSKRTDLYIQDNQLYRYLLFPLLQKKCDRGELLVSEMDAWCKAHKASWEWDFDISGFVITYLNYRRQNIKFIFMLSGLTPGVFVRILANANEFDYYDNHLEFLYFKNSEAGQLFDVFRKTIWEYMSERVFNLSRRLLPHGR